MAEEIETMGFWNSLEKEQELKTKELEDYLLSIFSPLTENDSNRCPTNDEGEE